MQTRIIPTTQPGAFEYAQKLLNEGKIVAFPTDTVYGLAAMVHNPAAIRDLYTAKGRGMEKAIPVLIGLKTDLSRITASISPDAQRLAEAFWPGALTLVLPRHPDLPDILSPYTTVGVRMPDHPDALKLLNMVGPLAVTSANRSGAAGSGGAELATSAAEVYAQLFNRIPLILDGGSTPGSAASTVVDCSGSDWSILRKGPISESELRAALVED